MNSRMCHSERSNSERSGELRSEESGTTIKTVTDTDTSLRFAAFRMTLMISLTKFHSLIALAAILFLAGCGKRNAEVMRSGLGGKKLGGTYVLNEIRGNPSSLDPVRMNSKVEDDIGGNIFDKLVEN